jgi:hypothetical protein
MARTFVSYWEININHYTILLQYILKKNKYTWERGAGLGWVVAAYFPLFVQIFAYNFFDYSVMARTSVLLGNQHKP